MELMFQPLRKYADFTGRARRAEYWLFNLFVVVIEVIAAVLIGPNDRDLNPVSMLVSLVFGLFLLAIFIPSLAVNVRRLHDTNRSGWWLLIAIIPLLGAVVLLVFTLLDGTQGPNRFGPDPKGRGASESEAVVLA